MYRATEDTKYPKQSLRKRAKLYKTAQGTQRLWGHLSPVWSSRCQSEKTVCSCLLAVSFQTTELFFPQLVGYGLGGFQVSSLGFASYCLWFGHVLLSLFTNFWEAMALGTWSYRVIVKTQNVYEAPGKKKEKKKSKAVASHQLTSKYTTKLYSSKQDGNSIEGIRPIYNIWPV